MMKRSFLLAVGLLAAAAPFKKVDAIKVWIFDGKEAIEKGLSRFCPGTGEARLFTEVQDPKSGDQVNIAVATRQVSSTPEEYYDYAGSEPMPDGFKFVKYQEEGLNCPVCQKCTNYSGDQGPIFIACPDNQVEMTPAQKEAFSFGHLDGFYANDALFFREGKSLVVSFCNEVDPENKKIRAIVYEDIWDGGPNEFWLGEENLRLRDQAAGVGAQVWADSKSLRAGVYNLGSDVLSYLPGFDEGKQVFFPIEDEKEVEPSGRAQETAGLVGISDSTQPGRGPNGSVSNKEKSCCQGKSCCVLM